MVETQRVCSVSLCTYSTNRYKFVRNKKQLQATNTSLSIESAIYFWPPLNIGREYWGLGAARPVIVVTSFRPAPAYSLYTASRFGLPWVPFTRDWSERTDYAEFGKKCLWSGNRNYSKTKSQKIPTFGLLVKIEKSLPVLFAPVEKCLCVNLSWLCHVYFWDVYYSLALWKTIRLGPRLLYVEARQVVSHRGNFPCIIL